MTTYSASPRAAGSPHITWVELKLLDLGVSYWHTHFPLSFEHSSSWTPLLYVLEILIISW